MAEVNERSSQYDSQLDAVLLSILTDMTSVRSALNTVVTKLNTLTVKLNSDGGVSDTNYATDFTQATALTTTSDA